ncbi:MAG: primosomal protein N' family DNA-binding protein, partial [Candidatus Limnocylindrales bacterium]
MAEEIESALDLGLDGVPGEEATASQASVEVAVDAPGATRTYDYTVPSRLAPVEPGEAVLVEFGRRQALGIVLGPSTGVTGIELKALLARVHADGPLLPRLTLDFARWISTEYLAPPAAVVRAMLPPGMLERLELMAEWLPPGFERAESRTAPELGAAEIAIRDRLAGGPLAVRDLEGGQGRAELLRDLRAMALRGLINLEWKLTAATAGPRFERWLLLTEEGRRAAAGGASVEAARLGPRQRALLAEMLPAEGGVATADVSRLH